MRNKILAAAAAAFIASTVMPYVASAGPSPDRLRKDGEIKDATAANAAVAKDEAKDAKKQAHFAKKKAKAAHHKAKVAAKKAHKADKDSASAQ